MVSPQSHTSIAGLLSHSNSQHEAPQNRWNLLILVFVIGMCLLEIQGLQILSRDTLTLHHSLANDALHIRHPPDQIHVGKHFQDASLEL